MQTCLFLLFPDAWHWQWQEMYVSPLSSFFHCEDAQVNVRKDKGGSSTVTVPLIKCTELLKSWMSESQTNVLPFSSEFFTETKVQVLQSIHTTFSPNWILVKVHVFRCTLFALIFGSTTSLNVFSMIVPKYGQACSRTYGTAKAKHLI